MELLLRLDPRDPAPTRGRQLLAAATSRLLRNSPFRARRNAAYHYDLGNEFFSLWLGRTMVYSCAYFRDPTDEIDTAQEQKFRHVCEKLRLEPGLTLLDIGCGWGGLAAYAATHYGVRVTGITLSEAQKRGADEMLMKRNLDSLVAIRLQDYRELAPDRPFDRIVSIGMFEHVGRRLIPRYLSETARLLAPGGVGLLHTIGRVKPASMDAWIVARIFPGAYFPALAEIVAPIGAHGLHPTDVESLGPHYAMTLELLERGLRAGRATRDPHVRRPVREDVEALPQGQRGRLPRWQPDTVANPVHAGPAGQPAAHARLSIPGSRGRSRNKAVDEDR
jgi:cyclopropane fatty-acyl-phospholipid synthase-like methyltransferase